VSAGVALITGAGSGFGEEMARQVAGSGSDLALCARRTERLGALAAAIGSSTGRRVETAALDVTAVVPAVFRRPGAGQRAVEVPPP
jgi:short-subunit dehydrogenase